MKREMPIESARCYTGVSLQREGLSVIPESKERRFVTLPKELWAWLEGKAAEKRWTVSQALEEAADQWKRKHAPKREGWTDE